VLPFLTGTAAPLFGVRDVRRFPPVRGLSGPAKFCQTGFCHTIFDTFARRALLHPSVSQKSERCSWLIGKLRKRHPIAVTKRIEHLPVMLIKDRPARFLLTDVLTCRFKRALGFHGRLLPPHRLRSVTDREQPAIFSKWFMGIVLRHGSRGRIRLVRSRA
jgi:hypothetical protein